MVVFSRRLTYHAVALTVVDPGFVITENAFSNVTVRATRVRLLAVVLTGSLVIVRDSAKILGHSTESPWGAATIDIS